MPNHVHFFNPTPETECRVGWDFPLQTFFACCYLIDETGEQRDFDDNGNSAVLVWLGADGSIIPSVDELQRQLTPNNIEIPQAIAQELRSYEPIQN